MKMQVYNALWVLLCCASVCGGNPVVTLKHGGQLQGLSTTYNSQEVDLFLGVRYAKPPTGDRRFRKPENADSWIGVQNATSIGFLCTQTLQDGQVVGEEDCLFLDITIPGRVSQTARKPVMVFIHGGGYANTRNSAYIGGPLATTGDVVVVTINYRLGVFGFLSHGPGTGNYGLWDQRAALLWVKENIEQFGGDPDLVTIFGESAGAGSVSAQTVSPHNVGLFKRAIQQSGALLLPLSWYASENKRYKLLETVQRKTNCTDALDVFTCLRTKPAISLQNAVIVTDPFTPTWHPVPDDDFFPIGFETNPNYNLSKRFDLLAGMNGQEGLLQLLLVVGGYATATGRSINNGVSLDLAEDYLKLFCQSTLTPSSAELCANFLINTYRLDRAKSDINRAVRLSFILGEINFDVGIVKQLREHSIGRTSTYAYHFTEYYNMPIFPAPRGIKRAATHLEELPFLFGAAKLKEETSPIWKELIATEGFTNAILNETLRSYHIPLSNHLMRLWTNFARTGNPNTPMRPLGYPTWPQFTLPAGKFLDINSRSPRVLNTPNMLRLDTVADYLLPARDAQVLANKAPSRCSTVA